MIDIECIVKVRLYICFNTRTCYLTILLIITREADKSRIA